MLRKFSVTNFKNYKDKVTFDLGRHANYEFNDEIIKDECVNKGIIYGENASGKSNLALALFDIVSHLTDKEKLPKRYQPYLNMNSKKMTADFEYDFEFDGMRIQYEYKKRDVFTLTYESLKIDDNEVICFDYIKNEGFTTLKGAENIKLTADSSQNRISRVKVVRSSSLLDETDSINAAFIKFMNFVDNMLMFYSLDSNGYQGFQVGSESCTGGIIREGKLKEFEAFLRRNGIDYKLISLEYNGVKEIYCQFDGGITFFWDIASTGTRSLTLFYYWYLKMSKASFVFVDEFDAFYHFELSQKLVELVKKLDNVQIFFTTHNTDLMSNDILRPDAYFDIKNNKIAALNDLTKKDLRKAHNIQKMYKAGSFNGNEGC